MKPKRMVLGIGSKKNINLENVLIAIKKAMKDLKIELNRIDIIATGVMKSDERAIIESCDILKKPLAIVDIETIKNFDCEDCSKSDFVKSKFGIDGLCEQCALIVSGENSQLIYKKTSFDGVTVAIAIGN